MTNLVRWDPFSDMRATMDRLFDENFTRPWRIAQSQEYESGFPVDVSQTDEAIDVKAAMPGMRAEDVEISINNDVLSIKAQHKEETEDKKREFYRREIRYGAFHRSLSLPVTVDAEKAEARFENGVLTLHLPKAEALRPKQIKVHGVTDAKAVGTHTETPAVEGPSGS